MFSTRVVMHGRGSIFLALGLLVAALAPSMAYAQADLEALVKAAKAEGEVIFYSTEVETIAKRLSDAYTKKYGIKVSFIRLASNALQQRYATEAEAGKLGADLIINAGNTEAFSAEGIRKGWLESIADAALPTIRSGEYPGRLAKAPIALLKIAPSYIIYNTEKIKDSEAPKDWPDLLNPKYKGQILIPDPAASDANLAFWYLVMKTFGEPYLQKLNAQIGRRFSSGVPTVQSLAAGEGMLMVPISYGAVTALKEKGAPLNGVVPNTVTGVETYVILTERSKAKHPNAARLMANYVLTREGNNALVGGEVGAFGVYELDKLPKDYQAPPDGAQAQREKIRKLLGF